MGQKTIPQLQATTSVSASYIIPIDSGIQSYKVTAQNLARQSRKLAADTVTAKTVNFNITSADHSGLTIPVNSISGAFNAQLPDPTTVAGQRFTIKDVGGFLGLNAVTLVRNGSESIQGLASSYLLEADYGSWTIMSDGTNWWFI